jgi:hypothetical protein
LKFKSRKHNVTTRTGGLAFRCRKRFHHWNFDGARDLYRAYPLAARIADANRRLPLHGAAAAVALHSGPSYENADGRSVLCSLVEEYEYPEAASKTDKMGRLPIHAIAECAEVWDEGVEAILNAPFTWRPPIRMHVALSWNVSWNFILEACHKQIKQELGGRIKIDTLPALTSGAVHFVCAILNDTDKFNVCINELELTMILIRNVA